MGNELQVIRLNKAICDDGKIIREQIKGLIEKDDPEGTILDAAAVLGCGIAGVEQSENASR